MDAAPGVIERLKARLASPSTRGGYALVVSSAITSVIGVVFWGVGARWWSTAELGRGAAIVAAMVLVAEIANLGMPAGLIRFLPRAGSSARSLIARSYLLASIVAAFGGAIVIIGLDTFASDIEGLGVGWSIWFVVATIAWTIFVMQDGVLVGLGRATTVPVENFGFAVAKLLALVAVASIASGEALFVAWTGPTVVVVALIAALIFTRFLPSATATATGTVGPADPAALFATTLRFAVLNHGASMMQRGAALLLPLIVISTLDAEANSYFYVAWTSAYVLYLVSSNFGDSLIAESSRSPGRIHIYTRSSLAESMGITVLGAATALLVAPWYLALFGSEYADNVSTLFRLLALAAVPNTLTTIYVSVMRSRRRLGRGAVIQAMLGLPMIAFSVPVLAARGLTGLGVLWLVNQTVVAIVAIVLGFWTVWMPAVSQRRIDGLRRIVSRMWTTDRGVVHRDDVDPDVDVLSNQHGLVVAMSRDANGVDVVLKRAMTPQAVGRLRSEAAQLDALRHAATPEGFASLVPELIDLDLSSGSGVMTQERMLGVNPPGLNDDMTAAIVATMGLLTTATRHTCVVDDDDVVRWVTRRSDVIARVLDGGDRSRLARLVDDLTHALDGVTVTTGFVHGDLSRDNVLVDASDGSLTGIIDWETGGRGELPELDLVQLMLGRRFAANHDEVGSAVIAIIEDGWGDDELALIDNEGAHPNSGLTWRTLVLLTWLRHLAANLEKSDEFAGHRMWKARNLTTVLAFVDERETSGQR